MPIYNETFESYRIEVRKIQNAMGLLIERGYKIIDLENNIIDKNSVRNVGYKRGTDTVYINKNNNE